jgi:homospermidine synthase
VARFEKPIIKQQIKKKRKNVVLVQFKQQNTKKKKNFVIRYLANDPLNQAQLIVYTKSKN